VLAVDLFERLADSLHRIVLPSVVVAEDTGGVGWGRGWWWPGGDGAAVAEGTIWGCGGAGSARLQGAAVVCAPDDADGVIVDEALQGVRVHAEVGGGHRGEARLDVHVLEQLLPRGLEEGADDQVGVLATDLKRGERGGFVVVGMGGGMWEGSVLLLFCWVWGRRGVKFLCERILWLIANEGEVRASGRCYCTHSSPVFRSAP
jgi:hypothetical protein